MIILTLYFYQKYKRHIPIMGCITSHEDELQKLDYRARAASNRFLGNLQRYKNQSFNRCNYMLPGVGGVQCPRASNFNKVGSVYCDECDIVAKQDSQGYLNYMQRITHGGWMPKYLRDSHHLMIEANIKYVAYRTRLNKDYLTKTVALTPLHSRPGVVNQQQFILMHLTDILMIEVVSDMICSYLDFTPELMAIRGPVGLKIHNETDVYVLDTRYRVFVYHHAWQHFIGVDTNNIYFSDMIYKLDPTFSKWHNSSYMNINFNGLNYCALDTTRNHEIIDLT